MAQLYNVVTSIKKGFLDIPMDLSRFYSQKGIYILKKDAYKGHNYVLILPEEMRKDLREELKSKEALDDFLSESVSLEARIRSNDMHSLKLSQDYLEYLRLRKNSDVIINTFDYMMLWKPEEFQKFKLDFEKDLDLLEIAEELDL